MQVAGDFGLTLSIPKTKVMAVGHMLTEEDKQPLNLGDAEIESVDICFSTYRLPGRVLWQDDS